MIRTVTCGLRHARLVVAAVALASAGVVALGGCRDDGASVRIPAPLRATTTTATPAAGR